MTRKRKHQKQFFRHGATILLSQFCYLWVLVPPFSASSEPQSCGLFKSKSSFRHRKIEEVPFRFKPCISLSPHFNFLGHKALTIIYSLYSSSPRYPLKPFIFLLYLGTLTLRHYIRLLSSMCPTNSHI